MRLTGYPSEEVMGHSLVKEFIRKEHQEKVQDVIDQTLHGEETAKYVHIFIVGHLHILCIPILPILLFTPFSFDFPLMTKGGVRLEILLNATTRRNEHGHIIGMVGIGQDVSKHGSLVF